MSISERLQRSSEETGVSVEEQSEEQRHEEIYSKIPDENLKMKPPDWNKFDGCASPHPDPYFHALLQLGDVRGKTVLDVGCGGGWLSVILAKRGAARVDAFDISKAAVRLARKRAAVNGVGDRVTVKHASIYDIPWPDDHYDLITGHAILHHVRNKSLCAEEIRRVVKPDGLAVFKEPLGNSAWLEHLRLHMPVPSEAPDDPEHWKDQIRVKQLEAFRERFDITWREFHLFSRLDRVVKSRKILWAINRFDMALLDRVSFLRWYARQIVIELRPLHADTAPPRPDARS